MRWLDNRLHAALCHHARPGRDCPLIDQLAHRGLIDAPAAGERGFGRPERVCVTAAGLVCLETGGWYLTDDLERELVAALAAWRPDGGGIEAGFHWELPDVAPLLTLQQFAAAGIAVERGGGWQPTRCGRDCAEILAAERSAP